MEDNMRRLITIIFSLLLLYTISFAQTHIPGGNVSGNWVIAGSPYIIDGEIQIQSGDQLIIDPGVDVEFSNHYKFNIYGQLLAVGDTTSYITFTAQSYTIGWHSLRFYDTNINGQDSSKIVFCKLEYGKATGTIPDYRGGAIYCENSSDILIQDCEISNNSSISGGGGIYLDNSDLNIENVTISNNSASGAGGGIYLYESDPNLYNVTLNGNTASFDGGGINCFSSSPILDKVTMYANTSLTNGGGISCFNNSNPSFVNVTISNNIGYDQGCAIACLYNSNINVFNSIIWNNGFHEIYISPGASMTFAYSDIKDGTGEPWFDDSTCIDLDPFFENPSIGDFHLKWLNFPIQDSTKSPCIDAGDPDFPPDPDLTRVDMGAFYYPQSGIQGSVTLMSGSGNIEDVLITATSATDTLSTTPGTDGTFLISISPPGSYTVSAFLAGYTCVPIDSVVVIYGQVTIGIDLFLYEVLPGMITGEVSLSGLGNVEDVLVTADGVSTNPYPVYDTLGVVLFYQYNLGIAAGTYTVTAHLTGYLDSVRTNVVVHAGQTTYNIDFQLQLITFDGYIEGTVSLLGGTGNVMDVLVTTGSDSVNPYNTNGDYSITVLEGHYDVTASLDGYTSVTIEDVEIVAHDTTSAVNMTLINWEKITGTQFSMILFTTASLDGNFVSGNRTYYPEAPTNNNQLAVFGPGGDSDCRGIAIWYEGNHPQWGGYWDLEGYWYITVVSHDNSGTEPLYFKVYETGTDSIYDCNEFILFNDNITTNINLNTRYTRDQVFSLNSLWNWISFNVHPEINSIDSVFDSLTGITSAIYQIKHQNYSSTYCYPQGFPQGVWIGNFDYITKGDGYLINMNSAVDTFLVNGTSINPITHPILLTQNWNWIGYYPKSSLSLEDALESISGNAEVIKNQTESAVYSGGTWVGDLTFTGMVPGVGYKICMNDSATLTYPENVTNKYQPIVTINTDNNSGWKLIPGTQYNMIAIADVAINNNIINSDCYVVGVFDEKNNCRSIGKWIENFWYFTIVGNEENEELHFKINDEENDTILETKNKITFINDSMIGNPKEPIIVSFKRASEINNIKFSLSQYPNPIKSSAMISYSLPESGHINLSIYNAKGQLVDTIIDDYQKADDYFISWNTSNTSSGIYFYKLSYDNNTIVKKFLILK